MSAGFGGGSYTQSANAQERNQEATVFVGGLDENVTDELLWELMIQAGPVKHVYIPRDRITRQAQGYGFCEFRTEDDAQYAVKILNMVKMFMKPIKVQPSSEHKRNLDVGANIFVGNLDPDVDEKLLHDTFNAFGVIIETPHIMRDLETGNSKGYGFVKFNSFEASDAAIEAMNGGYIMNRSIVVQYAYKKDGNSKERHGSEAERLLAAKAQGTAGQTRSNAAAPPPAANGNMGANAPHSAGPGAYSQGPPPQNMPGNGPPAHSGMQPPQGPPPQVMAPPGMPPHGPPPQGPPPQGVYGYNAMRGGPEGNPMPKGMPPPMRQPGNYGYGGGPVGGRPPGPPPPGSGPPSHPPPYRQGGAMYPPDGRGMPPPIPPRGAGADQVPQYGMQQTPGYRGPPPVPNAGPPSGARPPPPPTGQHGQPPYGSGMQRGPSEMPPPPPPRNPPNTMPPPPQSNRPNGY